MSWLKALGSVGRFFGKWAGGNSGFAKFASGVQKAANFVTTWAPKVISGVKTGLEIFRGGVGLLDKTGLLSKMDKSGKFRDFANKTGIYKSSDAASATPVASGSNSEGMTKTLG